MRLVNKIFILFIFCFVQADDFEQIKNQIAQIDEDLKNNSWIVRYTNYSIYQDLSILLEEEKNKLISEKNLNKKEEISKNILNLEEKIHLLSEYEKSPFQTLLIPPEIHAIQKISNPIELISAFSFRKQLNTQSNEYRVRLSELNWVLDKLNDKENLLKQLHESNKSLENKELLEKTQRQISEFKTLKDISNTTYEIYQKNLNEAMSNLNNEIKDQIKQIFNILGLILIVLLVGFLLKVITKKYLNARKYYTINKIINMLNFIIIIFILLFTYIENISYVITILGFASAGLAIALKDMFMSLFGWMVIVMGGSFHVGDRIKVTVKDATYVGDIIDISPLRITIYEDITLTTYMLNRRSGRIVFIPNNYVFTELMTNYTHGGMKTVWDGIDILISFDSNHKKAMHLIKNIASHYSQGYTDIAKSKMNKLREQYSLKNTNVEPRIYSFLEPNGIKISVWFQTNAQATLVLRSTISAEIIDAIKKEKDIKIAFDKQTVYLGKEKEIKSELV